MADALARVEEPADVRSRAFEIRGVVMPRPGLELASVQCRLVPPIPHSAYAARLPVRGEADPAAVSTTACAPDGSFALHAPPGEWTLEVRCEGFRTWREDGLVAGDFRWVMLDAGIAYTVRVTDAEGAAVEFASVRLQPQLHGLARSARASGTTDGTGLARLLADAGIWTLVVEHDDHLAWHGEVELPERDRAFHSEVTLRRGKRITGSIVAPGGGPPPHGCFVRIESLFDLRLPERFEVDANGRFDTGRRLTGGQLLEIAALAPGVAENRMELRLPPPDGADDVEVELVLGRAERRAFGCVVDGAGDPVAGARLWLQPLVHLPPREVSYVVTVDRAMRRERPEASNPSRRRECGTSDAAGRFEIGGMDPARAYSVLVTADGHANAALWIPAGPAGSTEDLGVATLLPAGRLFGAVRRMDGRGIRALPIHVVSSSERRVRVGDTVSERWPTQQREAFSATTGEHGDFSISELPGGAYLLLIGGEMHGPFEVPLGGASGPHVIELPDDPRARSARVVEGRVVCAAGEAVEGVLLRFEPIDGRSRDFGPRTISAADGTFRISLADDGARDVEAFALRGDAEPAHAILEAGATRLDLVLARRPESARRLTGVVRVASGAPAAGVRIELTISPLLSGCDCARWTDVTDADGAFDLGAVVDGAHRILVTDPNGALRPSCVFPARPGEPIEVWMEQ